MRILQGALLSAGLLASMVASVAQAQQYPTVSRAVAERDLICFMHTPDNRSMNLESLCRRVTPASQTAVTNQAAPRAGSSAGNASTSRLTCDDFNTWEEAQAALPNNPGLDGNKDGIACESLR